MIRRLIHQWREAGLPLPERMRAEADRLRRRAVDILTHAYRRATDLRADADALERSAREIEAGRSPTDETVRRT